MTTATAEQSATLVSDKHSIKIGDMDTALKDAINRWHDQAYKILVTLRATGFLLSEIQQDGTRHEDNRLDSALEITEQCIANLESLDEEIDSGAHGHIVIVAEPAA
ncbi:MAG: hypothetical protein IID41_16530 [Planctomycetes bacterium]|nr:hypothetical protein [Planctomycetota bacterium]